MDEISSAIMCSNCLNVLSRPVMLPCGHWICKVHIEQSKDETVICKNCGQQYSNCGSFVVNEAFTKVISRINSFDFGKNHKEAKKSCDNLNDVISQIDVILKDPNFYILEFIGEFRRRVDLKHEEYKLKLEQETQRILAQLDQLEAECKQKLKTLNEFKELTSAKEEAQQQLDEYLSTLNELKVDENKWKAIKERCNEKFDCLKENILKLNECLFELEPKVGLSELKIQIDIDPLCEFRNKKIDSKILNTEQKLKFLELCEFKSNTKFELLYRGTRDGFGALDFHAKCDNKPKTVTIIKSTNNNVFGGYTEASWISSSPNFYSSDPNAFLFSLINQHGQPIKIRIDPAKIKNAICNHHLFFPTFGGGFDICIANNCNLNNESYSKLGFTYKHSIYANDKAKAHSFLAGSCNFQVAEIDVYQIL